MKKNSLKKLQALINCVIILISVLSVFPASVPLKTEAAYENTHINTGNQRDDIVAVAETQVGYTEASINMTKYTKWNGWLNPYNNGKLLDGYDPSGYGYAWCHAFVSWCANQANISTDIIPKTAGTYTGRSFFVNQGTYQQSYSNGGGYVPQKGDIVYFGSGSNPSHVGIVSGCDGETVYTIEGNKSDKVKECSYDLWNSYVIGYGVPNYNGPGIKTDEPIAPYPRPSGSPLIQKGSKGDYVKWVQYTLSVQLGYSVGSAGVDGDFGSATDSAVKAFQRDNGLEVDGQVGPITIATIVDLISNGSHDKEPSVESHDMEVPVISTDNTTYTVGDTVHVSWKSSPDSSNLEHYWLIIDAPSGRILNETMNRRTEYSFTVSEQGSYTITSFATPYNSPNGEGSLSDSKTINVQARIVQKTDIEVPVISTDAATYTVGDTVSVTWKASPSDSNLSHYWLNLIDPDGIWVDEGYLGKTTSYSFVPAKSGDYSITIYATPTGSIDGEGSLSDTKTISVQNRIVQKPDIEVPVISTDSTAYTVGDTVSVTWKASPSDSNLSHYWLNLIDPDGIWVNEGYLGKTTSYSFVPAKSGDYSITIYATPTGSIDGEGSLSDSKTITVKSSITEKPHISILKADETSVYIGESILFNAASDIATGYTIGVDKDGTRVVTENMPNGTLSLTFDEPGEYSAYVTSYNEIGHADSERITFIVISGEDTQVEDLPESTESADAELVTLRGDANCDGKVDASDAVAVLQYIANKERYPLEPQGIVNADLDGSAGITGADVTIIQRIDAGLE